MADLEKLQPGPRLSGTPETKSEKVGEVIKAHENLKEFVSENASENASQPKGDDSSATATQRAKARAQQRVEQDNIRMRLISMMPPVEFMRNQIAKKLHAELRVLEGEAKMLSAKADKAHHLNNVVMKMRELQSLLFDLAHSTYEALKAVWLRVVHGIF